MIICKKCKIELTKTSSSYKCFKCNIEYKTEDNITFFSPEIEENYENYKAEWLNNLYKVEETHYWFLHRKKIIVNLFKKFIKKDKSILEIGAGTGNIAKSLINDNYNVSIGDIHLNGLIYGKKHNPKNIFQFDLLNNPFIDEFNCVCMFDVLEHIDNDEKALEIINSILTQNGYLILTVPAHQWLWSKIDEDSGHKKRYNLKELKTLLINNNFTIEYISNFYFFLTPLFYLRKLLNKNNSNKTGLESSKMLNFIMNTILKFERFLLKFIKFNIGSSIIVVAKKT